MRWLTLFLWAYWLLLWAMFVALGWLAFFRDITPMHRVMLVVVMLCMGHSLSSRLPWRATGGLG